MKTIYLSTILTVSWFAKSVELSNGDTLNGEISELEEDTVALKHKESSRIFKLDYLHVKNIKLQDFTPPSHKGPLLTLKTGDTLPVTFRNYKKNT